MLYQSAEISINGLLPRHACTVRSDELLEAVAARHLNSAFRYLIVENEDGSPVGVLGLDDLRKRMDHPDMLERRRWMTMPVGAAMSGQLSFALGSQSPPRNEADTSIKACKASLSDGQFVALLTEDDLMVSWRSIEELIRQAQHDPITDLPNRSAFDSQLRAECERAVRNQHSIGVILIDIDFFKETNDQFGHAAGDAVLKAVARTLRSTFRSYDLVARYGGDEFAVLCCGCRPGEIDVTINRLRVGIEKLNADPSIPRPVPTVSVGACVVHDPEQLEDSQQITAAADECLYFSKRQGRNRSFSTELGIESVSSC